MEMKKETHELKAGKSARVPQFQVRSDVCSGADLETCMYNLNKWQERYYYWYDQAKKAGKI